MISACDWLPQAESVDGDSHMKHRKPGAGALWSMAVDVLIAVLVVVLIRVFALPVFVIPSRSMTPTLQVGDRVVVAKISMPFRHVQRGDVVVFRDELGWLPASERSSSMEKGGYLVKRVIGVGGDHVACCSPSGRLLVNGEETDEKYVQGLPAAPALFDVTIPQGRLWVMGDNRDDSADSLRHWQAGAEAFLPESAVVGPVWFVYWPVSRWGASMSGAAGKNGT